MSRSMNGAPSARRAGGAVVRELRPGSTIDLTDRAVITTAEAATGDDADGLDPDGVLRACVRTLVGLAYRTPGFDVSVSSGADATWSLRLHHAGDGLRAQLLRAAAGASEGPQVELTPSPALLEAELATLLWSERAPAQ